VSVAHRWPRYDRSKPESVWFAIEDVRAVIDDMVTADEVAAKVSERLHGERFMMIGWVGKLVGLAIALATLATAIHTWV
jgi:hypothetical protein